MKRYLYLFDEGDVKENYDDFIVISPNYVKTIDKLKMKKKNFIVVDDWWDNKLELISDKNYIEQIKDIVLDYLTEELNKYHETHFEVDEWKIVLNAWLFNYITAFYEKYKRINQLRQLELDFQIEPINEWFYCLDYANFEKTIRTSKNFNTQIYLDIIDSIDKKKERKIQENIYIGRTEQKKTLGYYKYNLYRYLLKILIRLNNKNVKVIANDTYLPFTLLNSVMIKSRFRFINFQEDYLRHEAAWIRFDTINSEWRNSIVNCEYQDEFLNIALKCAKKYIPVAYLEGFDYLVAEQLKWFGPLDNLKAAIHICYGLTYDELYKNFIMTRKHKNKNLKLIDIQHGGNYGIDCNHLMKIEYDISDCIYTWGFEYNIKNCKSIRMPVTKLLNIKFDRNKADGTILYISYSYFKDFTMLEPSLVLYRQTMERELDFIKTLDSEIRRRMVIRLHPNERMWGLKSRIVSEIPDAKFDDISDYYSSLERASLVVCSDWNTTCVEALSSGYPTIILKPIDEIDQQAKEDALKMKNLGLLVETWEELQAIINQMVSEKKINEWWSAPCRSTFVDYIKEKYGYNPSNAFSIWEKELLDLCE